MKSFLRLTGLACLCGTILPAPVRRLIDRIYDAGPQSEEWDAANDEGLRVGSGVSFYRLNAGGIEKWRRMVLIN